MNNSANLIEILKKEAKFVFYYFLEFTKTPSIFDIAQYKVSTKYHEIRSKF